VIVKSDLDVQQTHLWMWESQEGVKHVSKNVLIGSKMSLAVSLKYCQLSILRLGTSIRPERY
jgi:hypothetical protein